jgi:hypothetical protein
MRFPTQKTSEIDQLLPQQWASEWATVRTKRALTFTDAHFALKPKTSQISRKLMQRQ